MGDMSRAGKCVPEPISVDLELLRQWRIGVRSQPAPPEQARRDDWTGLYRRHRFAQWTQST